MKVLIADDQDYMRAAVKLLLTQAPDVETIAEAADGAEAIEQSRAAVWDAVILDIAMPGTNGIVALLTINREQPFLPVVMLSTSTDVNTVRHCLAAGARGFVAKQSAFDE